eukprot:4752189-Amphidinium_carterae.1
MGSNHRDVRFQYESVEVSEPPEHIIKTDGVLCWHREAKEEGAFVNMVECHGHHVAACLRMSIS